MYATTEDLIDRYGEREIAQLTNVDGLDVIDVAAVERALDDANSEAHAYICARYPVPVQPAPVLLVRIVCDIARYRLYDDSAPDEVRRRYDDAVRMLRGIAAGEVSIAAVEDSPSHAQIAQIVDAPRLFARRRGGGLR